MTVSTTSYKLLVRLQPKLAVSCQVLQKVATLLFDRPVNVENIVAGTANTTVPFDRCLNVADIVVGMPTVCYTTYI